MRFYKDILSKKGKFEFVVEELDNHPDWAKYSGIAFSRDSQEYEDFKMAWDEVFSNSPRGLYYHFYVRIISVAHKLGIY